MASKKVPVMKQKRKPLLKRARVDLDFPLDLKRQHDLPLHRQFAEQLRGAITAGNLTAGTRLPSSRVMAQTLGVSRTVVMEALNELLADGYLEAKQGSGTFIAKQVLGQTQILGQTQTRIQRVSSKAVQRAALLLETDIPAPRTIIEFRLGQPSTRELNTKQWRSVWRKAGQTLPDDYGDPLGELVLRQAITTYVRRSRGLLCTPNEVMVTTGVVQSVDVIARALLKPQDKVAFEEPGYSLARQSLQEHGANIIPVAVDDDGLQLEQLPSSPILLYCTPSHHYPLGGRLPISRRLALLEWATRHGVLILEDDYDSEFRYDAPPLPALASLNRSQVIYLGTFSKVLSPALRVGYVIAPREVIAHLQPYKQLADYHTSTLLQFALAEFVEAGYLEQHVKRMRRVYAHKRQMLAEKLQSVRKVARLVGIEAGLHALLDLGDRDASKVAARALKQGVKVRTLEAYYAGEVLRNGLLLGYGGLTETNLLKGIEIVVNAI
jgi:GntR family transcriptional regulator / MocR family aminotransferase